MSDSDELLTVADVIKRLNVGRTKVYELLDRGELTSLWIDRCRRIPRSAVDAFIARKLKEAEDA